MSSELYTSSKKYYVVEDVRDGTYGPFSFKDAVQWQRDSSFRCVIAKVVIDEQGKEVR